MQLVAHPPVELLHGGVENRTEHRGVDLLSNVIVDAQPRHRVEVEAQRAGHVAEEGRRREGHRTFGVDEAFERLHHGALLGHLDGGVLDQIDIDAHLDVVHLEAALVVQLADVAARLAGRLLVGVRAVEHVNRPRPLDEAVEVVGVDTLVVFGGGQIVGGPQVVGDERRLRGETAGEVVVVHREQDDVLEVEVARLEDAHHLDTLERLAAFNSQGLTFLFIEQ